MNSVNDLWSGVAFSFDESESWRTLRKGALLNPGPEGADLVVDTLVRRREAATVAASRSAVRIERPVVLPPRELHRRAFTPLSRWEGAVVERFSTYFAAEVVDLRTSERASVEFDLDELTPSDLALCEPGALFYWTTGYETKDSGQRSRVSVINFRRTGKGSC